MAVLSKNLRRQLEDTVKTAREVAEKGSQAALTRLAVDQAEPFPHLSPEQRQLRNRLRARARQLGDRRDARGRHGIKHLLGEAAYEHWHRMLFARFLAENHLLMHPEGVAVSLADCEELAAEEGAQDAWELAGRYAARMLPQIFRPDEPVLAVALAPEHQRELERLVTGLPAEVFTASDSLGWVYQFWQARRKEEVNRSEVKIGADELPAVTQLFTEPYMVDFLLHNTLGAWWVSRHPREAPPVGLPYLRFASSSQAEEDVHEKSPPCQGGDLEGVNSRRPDDTSLPPPSLPLAKGEGQKIPAAGRFEGWPDTVRELKVLDPCCGSGHFLVAAFRLLVPMRMVEEGLSAREACDAVLRDNLYGLELDERCTQIAAFALALTAWTYPGTEGYRPLPELHIACSGISVGANEAEWVRYAGNDAKLAEGMRRLHKLFRDAPTLGSLIDPALEAVEDLFAAGFAELQPLLQVALDKERQQQNFAANELGVAAYGLAKAAELLAGKYHLVITNVPYLSRGKQDNRLKDFCERRYGLAKNELATVFLERCLKFCTSGGTVAEVCPQNWLFLTRYKRFREWLLKEETWNLLARLGSGAFDAISGEIVNVVLLCLTRRQPAPNRILFGLDISDSHTVLEKTKLLQEASLIAVNQGGQLANPDARISLAESVQISLLETFARGNAGMRSGDIPCFGRCFWELPAIDNDWKYQQSTVKTVQPYGGMEHVILWEDGKGKLYEYVQAQRAEGYTSGVWKAGFQVWGRKGVLVSQMGKLPVVLYTGEAFDNNTSAIVPHDPTHLPAIWAFCSSPKFNEAVRKIDQALKVTNASLVKVPFDLERWQKIAAEQYPNGLPKPYSDDPTQWLFHGHPAQSTAPLQVAVARLLDYRWPAEMDKDMELAPEARDWNTRCRELDNLTDQDGIVCLPAVRGEQPAHLRLQSLLARAYGEDWNPNILERLLTDADYAGKSLDAWLRDAFFQQHCALFHQRPFIWHIWDGRRRDGFSALVNYHKLDRKRLETLTYTYLGDWITRQEAGARKGEDGAEDRLLAARDLQKRLDLILEGEQPYDIFVRWKPLEEQPIGWEPDLNDGVRLNIRPFITTGVLRKNPKLHWNKDRGKDPESAPWFKVFGGERINDWHLSLEEKRQAREAVKESKADEIDTLLENPIPLEDAKPLSREAVYKRQG